MRNLIERLKKREKIRSISKIHKIASKSMSEVLRPIYILSNIFGLRVFLFPRNHLKSILSFIYSTSLFCLYTAGCFYYNEWKNDIKIYKLDGIISNVVIVTNIMVIFVICMMGLYQSKALELCTKRINEIDKTLQALGSSTSFNYIYKRTIIEIGIIIIYLCLFVIIIIHNMILTDQPVYETTIVNYLSLHIYTYMIEFLLVIEFLTVVRCIKSEFQRANELLSDDNILPTSSITLQLIEHKGTEGSFSTERSLLVDSKKLFIVPPSLRQTQSRLQIAMHKINRIRKLLRTIRQIHLELYRISKSISNVYGIQISLEIAICVLRNTYVLYCTYVFYQTERYNIEKVTTQFIIMILYCLQYSMKIFAVNYICDKTTKEAEHTSEIIHTFYGNNTDIEIQKEVEIFSLQMMQATITYSAFGLHNLNCKHICSCIGVITTYMVIMIQVTDSVKSGS